jgi:hypothetical protein
MTDKISFICIDKRTHDAKTNQTFITLENGGRVVLPPNVHSVPALLLIKQNYRVLLGDDIMKHLHPDLKQKNERATNFQGEPAGYAILSHGLSASSNITSEQYTPYGMTPEELSAKGTGGSRQLYNYVAANNDIQFIHTPPDTYRPDKLSTNVTIDTIQQQRMDELPTKQPPNITLGI